MSSTFLGYAITCPTCGNPDAYSIPTVVELQGVGEGGLVSYTHTINCRTCDKADPVCLVAKRGRCDQGACTRCGLPAMTRERWGRNARGEVIGP